MGKERKAQPDIVSRDYTINLHKRLTRITFKNRAPRAIREIKKFAVKMMGTKFLSFFQPFFTPLPFLFQPTSIIGMCESILPLTSSSGLRVSETPPDECECDFTDDETMLRKAKNSTLTLSMCSSLPSRVLPPPTVSKLKGYRKHTRETYVHTFPFFSVLL